MTYLGGDLLAKESWKKSPQAVFSKNDEVCGVGGPSIFTSPNGKTRCILYHGYLGKDTSSGRYCFMEPYTVDADGVHIGKDGYPSPLTTTFTVPLNTMPLGAKVSGFDNLGMTRVKLKIGSHTGSVNNHFNAALTGILGKFLHCFRCAVGRESVHFERYMQVIEQLRGFLHNGEVGSAAHDDANDWRHESLNY